MVRTKFDVEHSEFSEAAHQAAVSQVYPDIFPGAPEDTIVVKSPSHLATDEDEILDLRFKIDRMFEAEFDDFRGNVPISVQERFRHPEYQRYRDLTITEYNKQSDAESELHGILANIFVYGYYDADEDVIVEAIVVNIPTLFIALANRDIDYRRNTNPKNQDFISFKFKDLHDIGAVIYHYERDEQT